MLISLKLTRRVNTPPRAAAGRSQARALARGVKSPTGDSMNIRNGQWIMAPYMVETAHGYSKAAASLWNQNFLVAVINAALAVEILFKSFNARVSANAGMLEEKYTFDDSVLPKNANKHDLMALFDALPPDVNKKFKDRYTVDMLEAYRDAFIKDRYIYEPGARAGASGALLGVADDLIKKTVSIYRQRGCTDIWIQNYPNV